METSMCVLRDIFYTDTRDYRCAYDLYLPETRRLFRC